MKSIVLLLNLIITLSLSSQSLSAYDSTKEFEDYKQKQVKDKSLGDTLYYEDFAFGIPSGWTTTDQNGFSWIWSNSAPGGQYSLTVGALNSTTGQNGFLCLPSDMYNTPLPASGPVTMDAHISSPAIPIQSSASVMLRFQQCNRFCCYGQGSALTVRVSADNQNWQQFDAAFGGLANGATPNPIISEINVSSVLSNEDTAYIRFSHTQSSHYYWMIDDLALVEGQTVGLTENIKEKEIECYPNPTDGKINVKLTKDNKYSSLIVLNVNGKTVFDKNLPLTKTQHTLDLSHLETGIYYLVLEGNTSRKIEKVVLY